MHKAALLAKAVPVLIYFKVRERQRSNLNEERIENRVSSKSGAT